MSVTCSDLRLTRPADEKKQKTPKNMMKLDKSFSLQNPSKELLLFNSPKNIDFRGIEREFIVNDMKQYHAMLLHFLQASTGRLLLDVDLKAFEIASNHLVSDVTVQELCRINPSLRTIRLNGCSNISDISLWAICNLASGVRGVYLADCTRITNIGLRSFSLRCTELTTIDLSNCNQLDDASMSSLLSGCWKLETINLSGCTGISDEGLINIGVCRQLKHLNLNNCSNIGNFGSRVLKTLGSFCKDLREMYFRGCKRVEDAGLMGISRGCLSLECFEASGCDLITYRGLKAIFQNLKLLKKLTLRDCCLLEDSDLQRALRAREASFPSGFGDAALRSHDSLLELDISGARLITDKGIQALANSSVSFSLLALNLASTRVSDLTSTLIADHFTKLQSLDLSTCPLISDSSIQCLAMGVTALSTLKLNGTDRVTKETLMSLVGPRLRFAELATQWVGYQPKLDYLDCIQKAEFLQLHTRMTIRLQCAIRRKLALKKLKLRRHMNLLDRAIPLIQAKVRGSQQRSRFRRILGTVSRHKAALKIQSFYRKFKCEVIKTKRLQAERWLSCERRTALLAQRIYRGFVGRKDARSKRDQKANSLLIEAKLQARKELQATVIAKYVRAHLARKKTSELLAERERQRIVIMDREAKCRTLQRITRGYFGRNEANRNRNQLSIWRQRWLLGRELQRVFRGFQGRMRAKLRRKEAQLEREEFMAIRIQRVYKGRIFSLVDFSGALISIFRTYPKNGDTKTQRAPDAADSGVQSKHLNSANGSRLPRSRIYEASLAAKA